ncbi:Cold shock protein, CspA family [Candidatus Nanohalococcus occultus]|uniref:Cold shock protein, CspA family n=1 Tax=Candidatus Nanohalococcus occultus TaxID=2978047 RepID=A0ABY8CEG4_9ARCH|nr:Cold shock protein, CspA family [Candidatus Nanohaloarchaeota archaeon SVXNc]
MKGTVDFFHDQNHYGFIATDEMDDDVYFNLDEQDDGLEVEEGDEVEFDQEDADRGPKATNMTLV